MWEDDGADAAAYIKHSKLHLNAEKGCLVVLCDDDDVPVVKALVSSSTPPILHRHFSTMYGTMTAPIDSRFVAYHSVSVYKVMPHTLWQ